MRLTRAGATTARLEGPVLMVLWSRLTLDGVPRRCRVDRKKYVETQLDEFPSLVEELPESEVPAGMDRKKLLGIIGAGGAALSLPALLAPCGRRRRRRQQLGQRRRQLPGDAQVEVGFRQPRDDESVLRPDAIR